MATVITRVDGTAFVEITTATDAIVQNISTGKMLYRFDSSLPAVDADAGVLASGSALQKSSSFPAGNIYIRMANSTGVGDVAVSE